MYFSILCMYRCMLVALLAISLTVTSLHVGRYIFLVSVIVSVSGHAGINIRLPSHDPAIEIVQSIRFDTELNKTIACLLTSYASLAVHQYLARLWDVMNLDGSMWSDLVRKR
mmetsp:Transcript_10154/g.21521  ORF Transcript_10154/g.21521 Transcript_10154/m.21521 type:complete len:112 (-) Transcript_10154:2184-2519(-)